MSRRVAVCAGAMLLASFGCSLGPIQVGLADPHGQQRVVVGSVERVTVALEEGLADAGISVVAKRDAGEVRLVGKTKSGQAFCLLLRPEKGQGEKVAVVAKWGRDPDEAFWKTVEEVLALIPSPGQGS
jgi:hypothetical protein